MVVGDAMLIFLKVALSFLAISLLQVKKRINKASELLKGAPAPRISSENKPPAKKLKVRTWDHVSNGMDFEVWIPSIVKQRKELQNGEMLSDLHVNISQVTYF